MTYKEFKNLSKINFRRGGKYFFYCWDEKRFNYHQMSHGLLTKSEALELFKRARIEKW